MAASALPSVAPVTTAPALDTGRPYGSPFVPLTLTPAPSGVARIEHAGALTAEAEAWVEHTAATSAMQPETVLRKALDAIGFSVRNKARALAIPSKLRGVSTRQDAVALLAHHADQHPRSGLGFLLRANLTGGGEIAVSFELPDEDRLRSSGTAYVLGFVQNKHTAWLRPLLAAGAAVRLSAVTGRENGKTMGVNVLFAFVGRAIQARRFMRDGEPDPCEDDVLLVRTREGDAEVRFGRSAPPVRDVYEWGYGGAGPARLALAVLRLFVAEDDAQRLRHDFKTEVIATVPRAGVVLEAAFVRYWIARHGIN
jgi:hypothetical protein